MIRPPFVSRSSLLKTSSNTSMMPLGISRRRKNHRRFLRQTYWARSLPCLLRAIKKNGRLRRRRKRFTRLDRSRQLNWILFAVYLSGDTSQQSSIWSPRNHRSWIGEMRQMNGRRVCPKSKECDRTPTILIATPSVPLHTGHWWLSSPRDTSPSALGRSA